MTEESDKVKHFTDGQTLEELALRYPGAAESHIMIHRKLDAINSKLLTVLDRLDEVPKALK